jgi:hypothetical protein
MQTNDTTLLANLIKAHKEITEYRQELASVPANELPSNYDCVVISEWLGFLAHDVASDSACLKSGDTITRHGIDSLSGYLASYFDTHHILGEVMGKYELGVRKFFDHADAMLRKAIEDNRPTPPAKPHWEDGKLTVAGYVAVVMGQPTKSPKVSPTSEQLEDLAERATHALFATIHNELDPKAEHDLGGWSALNHDERFDSIRWHASQIARNLSEVVRNA